MRSLALNIIIIIINFALISAVRQAEDTFKVDIEVGDKNISCTFTMVFQGTTVNLKMSKAILSSRAKKTMNFNDLKIKSDSSGNIYTVKMMIKRRSTKVKLEKVVLKLATSPPECKFILDFSLAGCMYCPATVPT